MDIGAVRAQLPHRYPMLLVDRVTECVPGTSIRALKNVTANEPFFQGHFPYRPVMPGVMILEAGLGPRASRFRTAGVVPNEHSLFYFVGIDGFRRGRARRPAGAGGDAGHDPWHLDLRDRGYGGRRRWHRRG
jgi:3-hydroxyacyl-[acyl-carrier-protein] dehydratase